jgi:PAS domain S-box-containing protein
MALEHDLAPELERVNRLYSALSRVNRAITRVGTRDALFHEVCTALVEQAGLRLAWIGWHDPLTRQLKPAASVGDIETEQWGRAVYTDERPEGNGPSGRAFRLGQSVVCNDLLTDPHMQAWRSAFEERAYRSAASSPIRQHEQSVGVLTVYADTVGYFQEKEMLLLEEVTSDVSFALDMMQREDARVRAAALAAQEQAFSAAVLESMPGVVYLYDEQRRFLRWNDNFLRVTGYTADEMQSMHPLDFFSADDRPLAEARIADVFAHGEAVVEAAFVTKDGRHIPYLFTGRRLAFDGYHALVGMGIDISERKRADHALERARDLLTSTVEERTAELRTALVRAESADRLKSAFLATMSHELRTPLNSIIGFTGIVLQELAGPLSGEQKTQLGMVRGSARHLLELINDVLDISKIEAGQMVVQLAPFDLVASLTRVVASVQPQADKKQLALSTDAPSEPLIVVSDRRRVEQIMLNLINNAIKFTDRGSVRVEIATIAHHVVVRVIDTGTGIDAADLVTLFQPFHQIDTGLTRQHDGTGLGLAICRRLATLLNGQIAVASERDRGSTFTLSLPLAPVAPAV